MCFEFSPYLERDSFNSINHLYIRMKRQNLEEQDERALGSRKGAIRSHREVTDTADQERWRIPHYPHHLHSLAKGPLAIISFSFASITKSVKVRLVYRTQHFLADI